MTSLPKLRRAPLFSLVRSFVRSFVFLVSSFSFSDTHWEREIQPRGLLVEHFPPRFSRSSQCVVATKQYIFNVVDASDDGWKTFATGRRKFEAINLLSSLGGFTFFLLFVFLGCAAQRIELIFLVIVWNRHSNWSNFEQHFNRSESHV